MSQPVAVVTASASAAAATTLEQNPPDNSQQVLISSFADKFHDAACGGKVEHVKDVIIEIQLALSPKPMELHLVKPVIEHLKKIDNRIGKVTPLIGAAFNGHAEMVTYLLLDMQADPMKPDDTGSLAIHVAVEANQRKVVERLLQLKSYLLEAKNQHGETALNRAAFCGHLEMVRYLANEKSANLDNMSSYNRTPLIDAAIAGFAEVVQFLDQKGNIIEPQYDFQRSMAIYLATMNGHLPVVTDLLERWPELMKVKDVKGDPLLSVAVYAGQIKMIEFFVDVMEAPLEERGCAGRTPLLTAAFRNELAILEYLVEKGAKIDVADDTELGSTAIHLAAQFGYLAIAKSLLAMRPRLIEAKNSIDDTPLHRAAFGGHVTLVELFVVEHHAPLEAKNNNRLTPLNYAARQGHLAVVEFLVKQGADLLAWDAIALAVHRAAWFGHLEVVKYFLETNPELLEIGTKGQERTLLALAAVRGHLNLVEFLVKEKQASVESRDSSNLTPFLLAKAHGHQQIVDFLRNYGAKENPLESLVAKAKELFS